MPPDVSSEWAFALSVILATFIAEDATLIAVGLAIGSGIVSPVTGLVSAFTGVLLGDTGLWVTGRLLQRTGMLQRWQNFRTASEKGGAMLARHSGKMILAARFVPGLRLPVYLAAGFLHANDRKYGRLSSFIMYATLAVTLWTPLLVGLSAMLGAAAAETLQRYSYLTLLPLSSVAVAPVIRLSRKSIDRWKRFEFWPAWIFYAPVVPYILYQSIRSGGFGAVAAANPSIPGGGIVGESKFQILSLIPEHRALRTHFIGAETDREKSIDMAIALKAFGFPVIMKPDASQRGASVRILQNREQMIDYVKTTPGDVLIQEYHPGPGEVGIFYVRDPDEESGSIFSITGKIFPSIEGDGQNTLRELIESHERYRFQRSVFFERFKNRLHTVPESGMTVSLGRVGNHCQGTLFYDRSDLITPELTKAVDAMARSMNGFYFGRFDIRFESEQALKAGQDFRVVEANGVTSESTNLYDPSFSLLRAYSILFKQWKTLFTIARKNRRRGLPGVSMIRIARETVHYYKNREFTAASD